MGTAYHHPSPNVAKASERRPPCYTMPKASEDLVQARLASSSSTCASRRHHQHATSCAASSPSFLVAAVRRRSFAKFTSERVFPCAPNRICANNCRIIATHAHYATIDVEKSTRFDRMHCVTSLRASRHATRICSARELTSSYTASLASKSNRKVSKPGGENDSFVAL